MASVILAMAIAAITMPFTAGAQNQQADGSRTLAVDLAQELMEEIMSKPFQDPQGASQVGPESGETSRAKFDNIDDYNNYTEAAGQIASWDGQVITDPAAADLSRRVTCTYVYVAGQDTGQPPSFIKVKVDVLSKNTPIVTLTRLAYCLHQQGRAS